MLKPDPATDTGAPEVEGAVGPDAYQVPRARAPPQLRGQKTAGAASSGLAWEVPLSSIVEIAVPLSGLAGLAADSLPACYMG